MEWITNSKAGFMPWAGHSRKFYHCLSKRDIGLPLPFFGETKPLNLYL